MQLGLSSEAAADAPVAELVTACVRRGLSALELVLGHNIGPDEVLAADEAAHDIDVWLSGIVMDGCPDAGALAALSRAADAPIIVRGDADLEIRIACAQSIIEEGGTALPLMSGPPELWLERVNSAGVDFAWHVDETCANPAAVAARILHNRNLAYVRLAGGGPEVSMQDERGIGALMGVLALQGYTGPLVITPSSQRYRVAWAAWLGRRGGWGCGSKAGASERPVPIQL